MKVCAVCVRERLTDRERETERKRMNVSRKAVICLEINHLPINRVTRLNTAWSIKLEFQIYKEYFIHISSMHLKIEFNYYPVCCCCWVWILDFLFLYFAKSDSFTNMFCCCLNLISPGLQSTVVFPYLEREKSSYSRVGFLLLSLNFTTLCIFFPCRSEFLSWVSYPQETDHSGKCRWERLKRLFYTNTVFYNICEFDCESPALWVRSWFPSPLIRIFHRYLIHTSYVNRNRWIA